MGDFTESFILQRGYWNPGQYRENWKNEINKIVTNESKVICLMTAMCSPMTGGNYRAWVMYRNKKAVTVIEKMWIQGVHRALASPDGITCIDDKIPLKCSKWKFSLNDVMQFANSPLTSR